MKSYDELLKENEFLSSQVSGLMKIIECKAITHISSNKAEIGAQAVESIVLDSYDAGFLNDFGAGNVGWWQDYIRSELSAAHDFYVSQIEQYSEKLRLDHGGEE